MKPLKKGKENETQNEQQNELQNQQQNDVRDSPGRFRFAEWNWPKIEDLSSLSWLKISPPGGSTGFLGTFYYTCPFFSLQGLYGAAEDLALRRFAGY